MRASDSRTDIRLEGRHQTRGQTSDSRTDIRLEDRHQTRGQISDQRTDIRLKGIKLKSIRLEDIRLQDIRLQEIRCEFQGDYLLYLNSNVVVVEDAWDNQHLINKEQTPIIYDARKFNELLKKESLHIHMNPQIRATSETRDWSFQNAGQECRKY